MIKIAMIKIKISMNKVMVEGNVSKKWKTSRTIMVPTTKNPEPKDHRPIALTNVGYKSFMSLVKDKIGDHIKQVEEETKFQSGFTGGRKLEANLFILQYCIEISNKRGELLFVMAIVFATAFDSVKRAALLKALM